MSITDIIAVLQKRKEQMKEGSERDRVIALLVRLKTDNGVYPWELYDLRNLCRVDKGIMAEPRFAFPIWDCKLDSLILDEDYERPDCL